MFHGQTRTMDLSNLLCRQEKHGPDETVPAVDLSVSLTVGVGELEELAPGVSALRGAVALSDLPDVGPFDVEVSCDGMEAPVLERGTYLRKTRADVAYTAPRPKPAPKPAPKPGADDVAEAAQPALPGVAAHGSEEWLAEQIAKDYEAHRMNFGTPTVESARQIAEVLYMEGERSAAEMAKSMARDWNCRVDEEDGIVPCPDSFFVIAQQVLAKEAENEAEAERASAGRHDCTLSGKLALHPGEDFPYFALHGAVGATVAVTFMEHAAMRAEVEELLVETPVTTFVDCKGDQLVIEDRRREFIGAVIAERQAGEEVGAAFWRVSNDFAARLAPKPMDVAPYPHDEPARDDAADHPDEWEIIPGLWVKRVDAMLTASGIFEASCEPENKRRMDARGVVMRAAKALSGKKGNVPIEPGFYAAVETMIAAWGKGDSPFPEEPGEATPEERSEAEAALDGVVANAGGEEPEVDGTTLYEKDIWTGE